MEKIALNAEFPIVALVIVVLNVFLALMVCCIRIISVLITVLMVIIRKTIYVCCVTYHV
jgi:hypothetical protein